MRVYLLWLIIFSLSVYSFKDFFKPTLFLIAMMAFYGHPDMPSNMAGIQGLNPWNLLMAACVGSYLVNKNREGLKFDMDPLMMSLLILFVILSLVSTTRLVLDFGTLEGTLKDRVELMEMRVLRETLTRLKWNKSRAAAELGLSRVGLRAKLDRYGIEPHAVAAEED